ncbi:uncharacterized protein LOC106166145 [Lingula anatina]|uniref:Uncharacterized protein LOC106166145 n=1 Tax=Lingula anatina TaxID=7574 RepID=A0A1S3IQ66_LINAN|nr:uncharacterized protein LOC106166145 [Lingula anatina]|eukprot:XP_013400056.1 uncharacterized protein LOC106166145 [Lingula anatina]
MDVSKKLDLNYCTVRNLTSRGVSVEIAQSIVHYRKRHHLFQHIDGLWKIPGMNRDLFNYLKHVAYIPNEGVLAIGSKIPYEVTQSDIYSKDSTTKHPANRKSVENYPTSKRKGDQNEIGKESKAKKRETPRRICRNYQRQPFETPVCQLEMSHNEKTPFLSMGEWKPQKLPARIRNKNTGKSSPNVQKHDIPVHVERSKSGKQINVVCYYEQNQVPPKVNLQVTGVPDTRPLGQLRSPDLTGLSKALKITRLSPHRHERPDEPIAMDRCDALGKAIPNEFMDYMPTEKKTQAQILAVQGMGLGGDLTPEKMRRLDDPQWSQRNPHLEHVEKWLNTVVETNVPRERIESDISTPPNTPRQNEMERIVIPIAANTDEDPSTSLSRNFTQFEEKEKRQQNYESEESPVQKEPPPKRQKTTSVHRQRRYLRKAKRQSKTKLEKRQSNLSHLSIQGKTPFKPPSADAGCAREETSPPSQERQAGEFSGEPQTPTPRHQPRHRRCPCRGRHHSHCKQRQTLEHGPHRHHGNLHGHAHHQDSNPGNQTAEQDVETQAQNMCSIM